MRGSEVVISLSDMNLLIPSVKRINTMKIRALETGEIVLGADLRKRLTEKMPNGWKVRLYATDDMKIMALHPDEQSDYKFSKEGRRVFKEEVDKIKKKGYKFPAIYNVEWNEQLQSWVGILQEVAESPVLIKRGRKNGK